jgi:hypothetical protein
LEKEIVGTADALSSISGARYNILPSSNGGGHGGIKAVSAFGFILGGAIIGSAGTHIYNKKVHSAQRNIELILIWMLKNVRLTVGEDKLGVQVGPAKVSFGKAPQKKNNQDKSNSTEFIDDDDVNI